MNVQQIKIDPDPYAPYLLSQGMRVGELAGLTWGDIDEPAGENDCRSGLVRTANSHDRRAPARHSWKCPR